MVKRSTITGIYDRVHRAAVTACWVSAFAAGAIILIKSADILFNPKKITIEDLPEYKRIVALKEKENDELMKE